jgi:hypothetical protein
MVQWAWEFNGINFVNTLEDGEEVFEYAGVRIQLRD